jgi:hypothetical protein
MLDSELQGGSPRLCRLRTVSTVPCCKFSSLTVIELDDILPCFTGVHWDSVRAAHGLPIEVFVWKTTLG